MPERTKNIPETEQNRALRKPESEEGKILIKTKLYKLDKKCVLIN